jgi:hypothetical protein
MLLVVALAFIAQMHFSFGAIPSDYAFNLSSADSSSGNPKLRYSCDPGSCHTYYASCCNNNDANVVNAPECHTGCFECPPGTCSSSNKCVRLESRSCPAHEFMTAAPEDGSCGLCSSCWIPQAYSQLLTMKTKCIQPTSNEDGAEIIVSTCSGGQAQNWTFQRVDEQSAAVYAIVNQKSGKCLNVPEESKEAGVQLIQWPCHPDYNNGLWTVQMVGAKGAMKIMNLNSGLNLDVYNGPTAGSTTIIQNTPSSESNQVFLFPSCPADKYLAGCGAGSRGTCADCSKATCPAGQYRLGCGGGSPGKCAHCSTKKCPAGAYLKGCRGEFAGRCKGCSSNACPAGTYLEGCGGTSAGKCTRCSTKRCPAGMYRKGCSGTSRGKCVHGVAPKP